MSDLAGLAPLAGGMSGETFSSTYDGERVVVRIYAGRSASRGAGAAELDAGVLAWVAGVLPVPQVLEVRAGDPEQEVPALLVTSYLPGVLLEDLLPTLDDTRATVVGEHLGAALAVLAGIALPRPGLLRLPLPATDPLPPELTDLTTWVEHRAAELEWAAADLDALIDVADDAQDRLDGVRRSCLVHADFNPKNLLVDHASLAVTGVLDWEFAHVGSPYADLGNLLRFHRRPAFVEAVLSAREARVPDPRADALGLARAHDLYALVDLAARRSQNPVAARAHERLLTIARAGDPSAT